eukprot:TRINITY_DN6420_c0_g2_i1.p5 TRINITY_DN6420_c0_g2~~TRINITY_DN6420_c0_g2_i1.p5  ORF type:complete len:101 (-),score=2.03 TRINITY_DN6420_c0_g2_i1:149-451(-)
MTHFPCKRILTEEQARLKPCVIDSPPHFTSQRKLELLRGEIMQIGKDTTGNVLKILHEEIVPAQGCTEPIAIALVAAKAKEVLGELPERVKMQALSLIHI